MSTALQSEPRTDTTPSPAHPAFEWQSSHPIDSLNLTLESYRHRKTGARHYHLAADDPENVFLVAFRTVPMDSTGVAHMLEHTALCGSERFPVRDPFFMMIRRSLNTFMNAMTSSDWTAYPFASKNRKDFDNLLQIYLDAAFFSNLDELDFAQEGHRLEFSEPDNPDSPLQFKGVVYNEMKGAMSATNARLYQTMCNYLYPTTTYHYNSGGEPDHIPDLAYEELVAFYRSHYHPSNAIFMTFGDIPAEKHQARFEALALHRFEAADPGIHIADEKRYLAPLQVTHHYPADEEDGAAGRTHITLGWLLGYSTDTQTQFRAQLLNAVLLDHSASPLLRALETTDLGSAPSPLCGLEDANREISFMCGLEGCASDATAQVEQLVLETLEQVARDGVDPDQVEAALHQLELGQREIAGDGHPYGLQLMATGLTAAVHGGDPLALLDIDPVLEQLREDIRDPQFIPGLIREWLLDNTHRVTLTLQPDAGMAARATQAEQQRLQRIQSQLDDGEKQQIVERARALKERQEAEDDDSILPRVGLEDVPAELPDVRGTNITIGTGAASQPARFYAQGTNGLSYQHLVIDLPALDDNLLDLLPLYTACLTELGVGERDYAEVQSRQSAVSGGLSCAAQFRSQVDDVQQHRAILTLSGKALQSRQDEMSELLHDTFFHVRFDETQRIRELIEQMAARQQHAITGRGHMLAVNLASSGMSPTAALNYRFGGLQGIRTMKTLSRELASDGREAALQRITEGFRAIHEHITAAPRQFLLIGEEDQQDALQETLSRLWQEPAGQQSGVLELPAVREPVQALWTTQTQVNFVARAFPTVHSAHPDHAPLCVLASLLRNSFLHRAIREQGGAYGAGADQDGNSAAFRFFSYRDPRLQETLDDFDRALDWVLNEKHEWQQIEEAILGVISSMDRSTSPAGAARQAFFNELFGRSRDHRMDFRKRVLDVNLAQLQDVAARYLRPEQASTGVVSHREANVPDGLKVENL
ncbi:MAG: insulinase family protein [Pseudohongiellaceae bacterium]